MDHPKRGRGRPQKDRDGLKTMQVVNVPVELIRRLDIQTATEGRDKYMLVIEALEDYLERRRREAFEASGPVYE